LTLLFVLVWENSKQARNLEQKREWALQLKRVILENYDAVIPHHARQLVLQLGQDQHCNQERPASNSGGGGHGYDRGDYAYSATSSGSGSSSAAHHHVKRHQHSAPEYLERRKLDRRPHGQRSQPQGSKIEPRRIQSA
jgi:hypothetical protein